MHIAIVGTRGIPARYGGFETFADVISVLLAENGYDVSVECDAGSYNSDNYKGVKLFFATVKKSDNPLRYYSEGIRWGVKNSDAILAASSAGSFFYFYNLFRRVPILTNPDGLEYQRGKWSFLKRTYLKLSEFFAVRLSDFIIADSEEIKKHLCRSYRFVEKKTRVIEYGTFLNLKSDESVLKKYNLNHNKYYLVVCRLEPENNLNIIIEGFLQSGTEFPLVIIGNLIENQYVRDMTGKNYSGRMRFLGGIYDKTELNAIRYSCLAYVHGHSVGGTNPSLLEAMGSGNIILAHDNVFNREVTSASQFYFTDPEQFAERIKTIESLGTDDVNKYKALNISIIQNKYNWNNILTKYLVLLGELKISR